MSDVIVGVAVSLTCLNGERHACPYQIVVVGLHAVVHKIIFFFFFLLNDHMAESQRKEVSVTDHACVSFALQIAMVVNDHTLLAVR